MAFQQTREGTFMVMLKRIKEIKNIGVFSNFSNGASIGLEKINFIYGLNTYGKTTLTDIFLSLKNNDSSIITSRKTIPKVSYEQKVTLSIQENHGPTEKDLLFKGGCWSNNTISKHIEIFGTEFIHKNIFTGLTIERENKENFTQFILGEQGVSIAEQIRSKRQILGNIKKDFKNSTPAFFNGMDTAEINSFIEMPIDSLVKTIMEKDLYEKKNSLKIEKERLIEPSKILNLPEPNKLEIPENIILEKLNSLNNLFMEDYSSIKEDSIRKLEQHLSSNFSEKNGAENWVKSGLHYCIDQDTGNCPFCGQNLKNVRSLIALYNSYFDEEYNAFINRITNELNNTVSAIETIRFNKKSNLQTTLNITNQYKLLISDLNFASDLLALDKIINSIREDDLDLKKNELLISIRKKVKEKIQHPYKRMDCIELDSIKESINDLRPGSWKKRVMFNFQPL